MAFDKTWIVLIAGCGVLGLAVWGGLNAMTLKMILLWMFIGFGFLTFLMHLFGSPISILLGKFLHNSSDDQQTSQVKYTDAELKDRRQRALQMKQFLQDSKVDIYRENILEPREEILKAKQEEEFYKFDSRWRGKGQRLGKGPVEEQAEDNILSQEFLLHEDPSSEEETDTEESPHNDTSKITEFGIEHDCMSRKEDTETNSVRQRRHRQSCELPEEPDPKEKGVITVALRCPDGTVKKRRFTVESQIKVLFTYADWLGYSPSCHALMTTYPRKQLSEVEQTLCQAGLTHDTALVLEEI